MPSRHAECDIDLTQDTTELMGINTDILIFRVGFQASSHQRTTDLSEPRGAYHGTYHGAYHNPGLNLCQLS